ncbi:hypothetical protein PG997_012231 [Apiospora hydei]|uniref:BRCT domain-containing protein n=1 Tax=Apiospora hydei TaxID=1337664 RepID=A0ABR1V2S2_9PEZI
MSLVAQPKPIFRGLVVATTGNVGQGRKGWSESDIQRYLESWGGRYSPDLDASVTHLIAIPEELQPKNRSVNVNSALKRKNLTILSLDWLEDSFIETRKLPPDNYLLAKGGRSIAESTRAKRLREQKKAAKEDEMAKTYPHPRLFIAYTDETFFRYEIVLTRDQGERYTLTLFESNAKPHMYHVGYIFYRSKGAKPIRDRMEGPEAGGTFDAAFKEFTGFFKRQTGVEWDDRVAAFRKGKNNVTGRGFVYELPAGGKPIGLIKGEVPDMDTLYPSDPTDYVPSHPEEESKVEEEAKGAQEEESADPMETTTAHNGNTDMQNAGDSVIIIDDDSGVDDVDEPSNTAAANDEPVDEGYESI